MIVFVTLFLGLVLGPQTVEVAVSADVARVELRLDGRPVAALAGPPWETTCDLGSELLPHELVAVAYDADGRELARVRQGVNLPRDPAEASLALVDDADGRVARLSWESIAGAEPAAVRAFFDGRPLAVADPRRIPLPPHDAAQLHFLRVELDFDGGVASAAELAFGGRYGAAVASELTAVPLVAEGRKPSLEALRGRLRVDGREVEARAVERGTAEIVLVVDRAFDGDFFAVRHANWERGKDLADLRFAIPLAPDQRLRFVDPVAEERSGVARDYRLFPVSAELADDDGGLYFLLVRQRFGQRGFQRLADAVAVAGLEAAGRARRRAVVLVLSSAPSDASELAVAAVRRYLTALRVPLFVWTPAAAPAPQAAAWGETTDVSTMAKLERAARELDRALDRQWIVWLDGAHRPQDVVLSDEVRGLRLAP